MTANFKIGKPTIHDTIKCEDKLENFVTEVEASECVKKWKMSCT